MPIEYCDTCNNAWSGGGGGGGGGGGATVGLLSNDRENYSK